MPLIGRTLSPGVDKFLRIRFRLFQPSSPAISRSSPTAGEDRRDNELEDHFSGDFL
jgi:hypothetical protein